MLSGGVCHSAETITKYGGFTVSPALHGGLVAVRIARDLIMIRPTTRWRSRLALNVARSKHCPAAEVLHFTAASRAEMPTAGLPQG